MTDELLYLDSSALVKLVLPEKETGALLRLLASWPQRVSSALALVEVLRAARRASSAQAVTERAIQVTAGVHSLAIDATILEQAGMLSPTSLRSLDAIHLATALSLGDDLGAVVVYDQRLADAVTACGLTVLAPN